MKISLNSIWLTNDGHTDLQSWTDAHGVSLNGRQVVQDAQFLRAIGAQPLARGNQVNVLQFSVTRQHATVADAAAYVLTAFSTLPRSGSATVICGATGETAQTCSFPAVLGEMPSASFTGTRSDATFSLRGGAISMATPLAASGVDGGAFTDVYAYPQGGTIDGGNAADALIPTSMDLDGGTFV